VRRGRVATQERLRRGRQDERADVADAQQEPGTVAERRRDDDDALRLRAAGRRGERLRDPRGDGDREARVSREETEQGRAQGEAVDAAAHQERVLWRASRAELHRAGHHAVPVDAVRAESSACR